MMEISLLNLLLIASVSFAVWGMYRSVTGPSINKALHNELMRLREDRDKKDEDLYILHIDYEREMMIRRKVEEHYSMCKLEMIRSGVDVSTIPQIELNLPSNQVRQYIVDIMSVYFTINELNDIAYKLGVPFDGIEHTTINTAATELSWFMERRGRFDELINIIAEERPLLDVHENVNSRK